MFTSLSLHRLLKSRASLPAAAAPQAWRRLWDARFDRLDAYLMRLRKTRTTQSHGSTQKPAE